MIRVVMQDDEKQIEAEVEVTSRFYGNEVEPPEGGPSLQRLWINDVEISDPFMGDYDDLIEQLEAQAEEIYLEDKYTDGREL